MYNLIGVILSPNPASVMITTVEVEGLSDGYRYQFGCAVLGVINVRNL